MKNKYNSIISLNGINLRKEILRRFFNLAKDYTILHEIFIASDDLLRNFVHEYKRLSRELRFRVRMKLMILMGHLHGQESPDIPQRLILRNGKIKAFETIATMTGAWVKAFKQGEPPCYLERWGSPPSTLGCPRIQIIPDKDVMILEKPRRTTAL